MGARLTIRLDDAALAAIRTGKNVTINSGRDSPGGGRPENSTPTPGTLPAKLLEWAEQSGTTFTGPEVAKRFKLSRAHASMLLSRVTRSGVPIQRIGRGVYGHAKAEAQEGAPRPGSLAARILVWASKRREPFESADVQRRFRLSRPHASALLSRLATGRQPIEREGRGVYSFAGAPRGTTRRKRVTKRK